MRHVDCGPSMMLRIEDLLKPTTGYYTGCSCPGTLESLLNKPGFYLHYFLKGYPAKKKLYWLLHNPKDKRRPKNFPNGCCFNFDGLSGTKILRWVNDEGVMTLVRVQFVLIFA